MREMMLMPWQQQMLRVLSPLLLVLGQGLDWQGRAKTGVQEAQTTAAGAQAERAAQPYSKHAQPQPVRCRPSLRLQGACTEQQGLGHSSSTAASAAAAAAAAAAVLQSASHQQQLQWQLWMLAL
jgi:hypothetical protein